MKARMSGILLALLISSVSFGQDGPDHKWSGVVFTDYYYNVARDTGFGALSNTALGGAQDANGFNMRRIYLTFDKNLTSSFSMRIRLETDESANASNGKIGSFIKDAYIKWKGIFSGSDLIFGIQPTPAFEVSEKVWGYRGLEKTIMDLRGAVSSRDQGIALQGKVTGDGMIKYKAMYANGSANRPETNKYKRYFGRVEVYPTKQLTATVYADLSARQPLNTPSGNLGNNILTYAGFIGYTFSDGIAVGAEGYMQSVENGFVSAGSYTDRSVRGLSLFGRVELSDGLTFVGRVEQFDPNTDGAATGDARTYVLAGLDWNPDGKISIVPNLQAESYESIGGTSVDMSLTGRITVLYKF